ncbi:SDR family oxidoreductase [Streptomyces sp. SID8352]|uniref:SDR family oxidoreductase n=1 Tax=Streptomyces sp. SID8352 TaxID=2690338 RepID=UPI00136F44CA|nr:SDR family oxidoreductase [Streptomyces sp. SID8352]MYU20829.1 NAD-dependent epimerase/dehydratase family protein [Streptomyces sp. SID8352]
MTTRLLTGATGFVGGAVVLELLDRTEGEIYALVRGEDSADARRRLHEALIGMARGYGRADLETAIVTRTRAIRGDMARPGCGVDPAELPAVDELWHAAASLRFEEEYREEIEALNVGGTRNVLELARRTGARTFNYVSTAYVAGSRKGDIAEGPAVDPSVANNCYEETKVHAEALVSGAADGFDRVRIMRPTIVIGHSLTRHGLNWSGMYGFARQMMTIEKLARRKLGTLLAHARLNLIADPHCPVNLVPVDIVARNAVSIALSDSEETYFHLGNSATVPVHVALDRIMELVGLRPPHYVTDPDCFTALDEQLDKGMVFYGSYLKNPKRFDLTHTEAVCGTGSCHAPLDLDEVTEYVLYYLRRQRAYVEKSGPIRTLHPVVA